MNTNREMGLYNRMSHQDKLDRSVICPVTGRPKLTLQYPMFEYKWEYIEDIDEWVNVYRDDTIFPGKFFHSPEYISIYREDCNYLYETDTGTLYAKVKRT